MNSTGTGPRRSRVLAAGEGEAATPLRRGLDLLATRPPPFRPELGRRLLVVAAALLLVAGLVWSFLGGGR